MSQDFPAPAVGRARSGRHNRNTGEEIWFTVILNLTIITRLKLQIQEGFFKS